MFILRILFLNLRRRKAKSALVLLTCAAFFLFVFIFMNTIETNRKQLIAMSQQLPVTAKIINIKGSLDSGLYIPEKNINIIADSGYTKDLLCTARLTGNFPSAPVLDNINGITVYGVNDIQAIPNFQERRVDAPSQAGTDFLSGNDAVCLAGDIFMLQNNFSIGDIVDVQFHMNEFDSTGMYCTYELLGDFKLRIVGSVSSALTSNAARIDIVCPLGWVKDCYNKAGKDFYLDSASFTVADPLKLNEFKAEMKKYFASADPTEADSRLGKALSVRDETFISTAGRVESTLNLMYAFTPVLFLVIIVVGYAIAYLLMQSRLIDIAVMRSLGTKRKICVGVTLIEYAVLGLAGTVLGALFAIFGVGFDIVTLLDCMLFFVGLMLGIFVAALQISRINTMTGLVKAEL